MSASPCFVRRPSSVRASHRHQSLSVSVFPVFARNLSTAMHGPGTCPYDLPLPPFPFPLHCPCTFHQGTAALAPSVPLPVSRPPAQASPPPLSRHPPDLRHLVDSLAKQHAAYEHLVYRPVVSAVNEEQVE